MEKDVRIERIARGEESLCAARTILDSFAKELERFATAQDDVAQVSTYLGSEEWFDDRDADAKGELDANLRAGVLTEDLGYDLIVDNRDLAIRMLEIATQILRDL